MGISVSASVDQDCFGTTSQEQQYSTYLANAIPDSVD
jgi:hypothetical protein